MKPNPIVLVIDDEAAIRRLLRAALEPQNYQVYEAETGQLGLQEAVGRRPDIVILDLGLPDMDGLTVLKRLREWSQAPVLVLSVRDHERSKVEALDAGADDYVTKPFGAAELLARLRAVLRRAAGPAGEPTGAIVVGDLRLDVTRHEVSVAGRPVQLTPREFEVLKVLLGSAGRLVTHGRMLRAVWGTAYSDEAHYLHVYVSQIRRKIAAADPSGGLAGLSVAEPGGGYRVRLGDAERS